MNDDRVDTPKQLADRVGVSEYLIKSLIRSGDLEHIQISSRIFIPTTAWPRYLEANTKGGKQWRDETKDQGSVTWKIAEPTTSLGRNTVAAANARRVRQTAHRLKASSRNGSNSEAKQPALVIPLKRSSAKS